MSFTFLPLHLAVAALALALHMTWFASALPVLVFQILHALGWRRHEEDFWPDAITMRWWTRKEWVDWAFTKLHPKAAELLTCPWCLPWHLNFWLCVVVYGSGLVPGGFHWAFTTFSLGVLVCLGSNLLKPAAQA